MNVRIVNVDELESCLYPIIKKAIEQALAAKVKPEPDDLLSFKQACMLLGMAPSTLYNRVSQRSIPNFKKGRRLFFSRKKLLDWIESGERPMDETAE